MGQTMVAKVYGTEVDRKRVDEATEYEKTMFMMGLKRRVGKEFHEGIVIEVKNWGRKKK